MILGWAINCAMIILAAAAFYKSHLQVTELPQAEHLLHPLLGDNAAGIFAIALLFSGIASGVTSGIAAGTIFSGIFGEPYHLKDTHTRTGISISLISALIIIVFIHDPFHGLILSQMILSIQLPITIFMQIYLTSSRKVMGTYANNRFTKFILCIIGAIVTLLNIILLLSVF
jgi:manganese transport protein